MAKGVKTGGRKPGVPNKMTAQLKEMILTALDEEGGVTYLRDVSRSHPAAFLSLVGKVLPMTVQGTGEGGAIVIVTGIPKDDEE